MPSEQEVVENGLDVAEMQAMQQQKIEELTFYTIAQQKKIEALEKQLQQLLNLLEDE